MGLPETPTAPDQTFLSCSVLPGCTRRTLPLSLVLRRTRRTLPSSPGFPFSSPLSFLTPPVESFPSTFLSRVAPPGTSFKRCLGAVKRQDVTADCTLESNYDRTQPPRNRFRFLFHRTNPSSPVALSPIHVHDPHHKPSSPTGSSTDVATTGVSRCTSSGLSVRISCTGEIFRCLQTRSIPIFPSFLRSSRIKKSPSQSQYSNFVVGGSICLGVCVRKDKVKYSLTSRNRLWRLYPTTFSHGASPSGVGSSGLRVDLPLAGVSPLTLIAPVLLPTL